MQTDPTTLLLDLDPLIKRFLSKVLIPSDVNGCWTWMLAKTPDGYGKFRVAGKNIRAHRFAFARFKGKIGEFHVCHSCDHPACVNPDHLFLGNQAENVSDMCKKGRQARGERHGARTKPDRVARGERHGRTKISDAELPRIFELRSKGLLLREIAPIVGLSLAQIGAILSGKKRRVF